MQVSLPTIAEMLAKPEIAEGALQRCHERISSLNPTINALEYHFSSQKREITEHPLSRIPLVIDAAAPMRGVEHTYGVGGVIDVPEDFYFVYDSLIAHHAQIFGMGHVTPFGLSSVYEEAPKHPFSPSMKHSPVTGVAAGIYSEMAAAGIADSIGGGRVAAASLGLSALTPTLHSLKMNRSNVVSLVRAQIGARHTLMTKRLVDLQAFHHLLERPQLKNMAKPSSKKIGWCSELSAICPSFTGDDDYSHTLHRLEAEGYHVEEVSLGLDSAVYEHIANLVSCQFYLPIINVLQALPSLPESSETILNSWASYAQEVTGVGLTLSIHYVTLLNSTLQSLLDEYAWILTPASSVPSDFSSVTLPSSLCKSLTYWRDFFPFLCYEGPIATFPTSFHDGGAEHAMQAIGKKNSDHELLSFLTNCFGSHA